MNHVIAHYALYFDIKKVVNFLAMTDKNTSGQ